MLSPAMWPCIQDDTSLHIYILFLGLQVISEIRAWFWKRSQSNTYL